MCGVIGGLFKVRTSGWSGLVIGCDETAQCYYDIRLHHKVSLAGEIGEEKIKLSRDS